MSSTPKSTTKTITKLNTPPVSAPKSSVNLPVGQDFSINLGCDPELFLKTKKRVIGAEHLIPRDGLGVSGGYGKVIIDGVQMELNPTAVSCRQSLGSYIRQNFIYIRNAIASSGKDIQVCFDQGVTISKTELAKLDANNQLFGCSPSFNAYQENNAEALAKVNPHNYRKRSAGGHIHIGHRGYKEVQNKIKSNPDEIIQLMDIIVGNTLVLIDRDPSNKERRKLYGRAGEYRLPAHGLEYRVPSNFWLQSYQLMAFVTGLVRSTIGLTCHHSRGSEITKAFFDLVDMEKVRKAINKNDFNLAYENFNAIAPLLMQLAPRCPITVSNIKSFHYFVKVVNEKGMKHWFKEDPLTHWCNVDTGFGWDLFMAKTVEPQRLAHNKIELDKMTKPV